MIEKYTGVECYTSNEGSFNSITNQDRAEVLDILNSKVYIQRVIATTELYESHLKSIIDELESEAEEKSLRGAISQTARYSYPQNCHSLARKLQERLGWKKVSGYIFDKKQLSKRLIILRSHSVIKNEMATLFELTELFSPELFDFIEHKTGEFGIDLKAYK